MTASYWHGKSSLPPVTSILSLSADHFNSEMFYGTSSSFECQESLQSSPSTSNIEFREPFRPRQPFQQQQQQQPNTHSTVFQTATFDQNRQIKHANSSPALFNFARKRRSIQVKLDHPQRPFVYVTLDSVIHQKDLPLQRLIENQVDFLPNLKTLRKLQKEITPEFRRNAVQWLEEVCVEAKCDVIIFPLAISLMDRFLSKKFVPKMHLQALGSACLLIAGKVKAPVPLTAKTIAYYTDGAVTVEQLLEWELAVTATLNWEFYSPTPFEFFDQILTRTSCFGELKKLFQKNCYRLFQDEKLACLRASHQASFCLGFAAVDYNDKKLYQAAFNVSKDFFGLNKQTFMKGVNGIGKLFAADPSYQWSNVDPPSSSAPSSSPENNNCNSDEGSPNKIQKLENLAVRESGSPLARIGNSGITSSTSAVVGHKIHRSHSTAFYWASSTAISSSTDIRKAHSSNSLQHQSFSDDSGFHSEVSSPECSLSYSTMTSPTTTIAGRKLQKARRSRNNQNPQASELLDCFYKI